jgi:hypothetical protein
MMHVLFMEWNALFKSRCPDANHTGDRVIVDDILMLHAVCQTELLNCLGCVLQVCQKALSLSQAKQMRLPQGMCRMRQPRFNQRWQLPVSVQI